MAKRVFIIHGWGGNPEEGWFPWLKHELESKGFQVEIPAMPDTENPRIFNWIPAIAKAVGKPDENTYFVGHSMGCQAIARYLETLPAKVKVGGAVFIAGFFKRLTGMEDDPATQETDNHWLKSPINFAKIKSHLKKSAAIFSDDDPWVPLDNRVEFEKELGSKIIIMKRMKHFSGDDGLTKLPIALESLIEISK